MVTEPYLTQFREQMLTFELRVIETTARTQFFFAEPNKIEVKRDGRNVFVSFTGDRLKIVAGQELPLVKTKFTVQLAMIPRNPIHPYGIAVSGLTAEDAK